VEGGLDPVGARAGRWERGQGRLDVGSRRWSLGGTGLEAGGEEGERRHRLPLRRRRRRRRRGRERGRWTYGEGRNHGREAGLEGRSEGEDGKLVTSPYDSSPVMLFTLRLSTVLTTFFAITKK